MAIPKGGFPETEQGRYGPIFPRTPACYGFSILAKIIPGREEVFYDYAKNIEKTVASQPDCLAVLKLHYLRWVLFPIKGENYFMAGNTEFNCLLWMPPNEQRAGDIVLVDSTNFTTLFGGTDSLENFWRNLALMK